MKTKSAYRDFGGWAVDGIEYPTLREAAQAIGEPESTLQSWCRRIGSRRVTSADLARMRRNAGTSEWQRLSGTRNTGVCRSEQRP